MEEETESQQAVHTSCALPLLRAADEIHRRHLARRRTLFRRHGRPDLASLTAATWPLGPEGPHASGIPPHNATSEAEVVAEALVPTYPCVRETKLGKFGEGGKWICREYLGAYAVEHRPPVVVSVGSRGDASFEQGVFDLFNSTSYTFDPFLPKAVDQAVKNLSFLQFFKMGLMGSREQSAWREAKGEEHPFMVNIVQLQDKIHQSRVDVLKVDCEGCELGLVWDLGAFYSRRSQPLGMIAMELHTLYNATWTLHLVAALEGAGYRLFHSERNPYCFGCYEVAFIHETLVLPPVLGKNDRTRRGRQHLPTKEELRAIQGTREDRSCYDVMAQRAERTFEAQVKRRALNFGRTGGKTPRYLRWDHMIGIMLAPTYPCQQQERLGVWGPGGAWVCVRHRWPCPGARRDLRRSWVYHHGKGPNSRPAVVTIGSKGSGAGSPQMRLEREVAAMLGARAFVFNPHLQSEAQGQGGAGAAAGPSAGMGEGESEILRVLTPGPAEWTVMESEDERESENESGSGSGSGSGKGTGSANTTSWQEYVEGGDIVFHEYGVVETKSVDSFSAREGIKYLSLSGMLGLLNLSTVAFLRIDCEGCEYDLVRDMEQLYTNETVPFGQVSMEIHDLKDSGHIMVLMNSMESLGFRLFHAEESGDDRMSYQLSYIHASCC